LLGDCTINILRILYTVTQMLLKLCYNLGTIFAEPTSLLCFLTFLFIFMLFIDTSALKRKRHKYGEMSPNTLQQLEDMEKMSKYQPLLCSAGFLSQAHLSEKFVDKGVLQRCFKCPVPIIVTVGV
jgi:hypothetical protein